MNKRDTQTMIHALRLAIKYEYTFLDAYKGIEDSWKGTVRKTNNNIKRFNKLLEKLSEPPTAKE